MAEEMSKEELMKISVEEFSRLQKWMLSAKDKENEKEINCYLFDQLSILERIKAVTDDEKALKQIAVERKQIERKLYQQPPLMKE